MFMVIIMSNIKRHLHEQDAEQQELWEAYLEFIGDDPEVWKHLTKNLKDLVEFSYDD